MKVEQACRFRTDEGYGITGKTAGFEVTREKALGELFNDSMNPIFPKLGTSVLTCAVKGPYAFYARNTYRSHANREAIFTHSYILPLDAYIDAMQQIPQRVLAVPISEFMSIQSCGMDMEIAEFPSDQYEELSLDILFEKYNLTPERYTRLLMGAYEAMTSNRSLRLSTSRTIENTEQMVRELVYCIVEGLLPAMKGRMTFSSGADMRMNISVVHAGCKPTQSGDLIFGVEDDSVTNIRARDELSATFFIALGNSDHKTRRELLQSMEGWLRGISNVEEGMSVMLIAAAYYYCSGLKMSHDTQIGLFRNFAKAAGKSVHLKIVNVLLSGLVQDMIDEECVSTKALSNIAEWYLMDSSEDFRRVADQALDRASKAVCVALVNAAIQLPPNENVYELVTVLMNRVSTEAPELTDDLRNLLVRWIVRENVGNLAYFCDKELKSYSSVQLMELARCILDDAEGSMLNDAQIAVLMRALDIAANNPYGERFSEEEMDQLDGHMMEFSGSNLESIACYTLKVRIKAHTSIEKQVNLLIKLGCDYPALRNYLECAMQTGADMILWEDYLTKTIFTDDVTGPQVPNLLWRHNSFGNPMGSFEKKAASLWTAYVKKYIEGTMDVDKDRDRLLEMNDRATYLLTQSKSLAASVQMRDVVKQFTLNQFWGLLSYEQIIKCCGTVKIDYELKEEVQNSHFKLPLWAACGRLMAKPDNTAELVRLIMENNLPVASQEKLKELMLKLTCRVIHRHQIVLWDLLLSSCWMGEDEYDFEKLYTQTVIIQNWIDEKQYVNVRSSAEGSVLLMDSMLRKTVIKKMDSSLREAPRIADALIAELKNSKRGKGRFLANTNTQQNAGKSVQQHRHSKPGADKSMPQTGSNGANAVRRSGNGYVPPFAESNKGQAEEKGFLGGLFGRGKNRK